MHLCLDDAKFHAHVFRSTVSDYFPNLVEVLHVEDLEILILLRALSSLGLQLVTQ